MSVLDLCFRIIELKKMINVNTNVIKMEMQQLDKIENYDKIASETLDMIDELSFYENQLNEIDALVDIKRY